MPAVVFARSYRNMTTGARIGESVKVRRQFLVATCALFIGSLANAQQKPPVVAYLGTGFEQSGAIFLEAFREEMRGNGMLEGRDYTLEVRWAENHYERFPALAVEVVRGGPAVIVVATIASARAAHQATRSIPIVMTGLNDPVGAGLVASLARPNGNITGLSSMAEDVTDKLIEILHTGVPQAKSVAVLFNPANPSNQTLLDRIRTVAPASGMMIQPVEFVNADDMGALFVAIMRQNPDALMILPDSALHDRRPQISALALTYRLPTIAQLPEYAEAGALMGYGQSRREAYRRTAKYVKKILDGAKPGDLPVEQPTKVELVINLKTARSLGLTIPQSLLLRADEVIQ